MTNPSEIISEERNVIDATKFVLEGVTGKDKTGKPVKIAIINKEFQDYDKLQQQGE